MAEGLLRHHLPEGVEVESAGLMALVGNKAERNARDLMQLRGIDIGGHRARQLTDEMCTKAELILAMDASQKKEIEEAFPLSRGRVFRLGEKSRMDIFDPYRMHVEDFSRCLDYIAQGVSDWSERIKKMR